MAGQSAMLTLAESKAMQTRVQQSGSHADSKSGSSNAPKESHRKSTKKEMK
jgi:hypothetical protein